MRHSSQRQFDRNQCILATIQVDYFYPLPSMLYPRAPGSRLSIHLGVNLCPLRREALVRLDDLADLVPAGLEASDVDDRALEALRRDVASQLR
jgi:hypothetical protein